MASTLAEVLTSSEFSSTTAAIWKPLWIRPGIAQRAA
jgi:hypothetical protein